MAKNIRCASCRFARQDISASEYTKKHCKDCELDSGCTCRKKVCKCGDGCEYKGTDNICSKQTLKWAAIECGCSDSEYYKALLNVTPGGDKQDRITWSGCPCGECGDRS